VLETEQLVLRHLTVDDLDELAALYQNPAVRRYFPEGHPHVRGNSGGTGVGASRSTTVGTGTGWGRRSERTGTS
jgi:RimJ/RimL family protein N-acetyltransferase